MNSPLFKFADFKGKSKTYTDDEENNIISCVGNQEDEENEILGNDAALEEEM